MAIRLATKIFGAWCVPAIASLLVGVAEFCGQMLEFCGSVSPNLSNYEGDGVSIAALRRFMQLTESAL